MGPTEDGTPVGSQPRSDPVGEAATDHPLGQPPDPPPAAPAPLAGSGAVNEGGDTVLAPAWRRVTQGEHRWPVSIAVIVAIGLQVTLPDRVAAHPRWLLPGIEVTLLGGLVLANPTRISRRSAQLRAASIALIFVITATNAWSAGRLVDGLLNGRATTDATSLLLTAASVWSTNVISFALWYWEMDRGGPAARAHFTQPHPDFLFAQMQNPELAPADWEPTFVDYLYLSFTNATAFSPTDVLPLARWTKLTMLVQSAVSLLTVALVIARAVNTLN